MIQIFSSTVFEGYLGIRLPLNGPFLCSVARTQHKLTVTYSIDTPLQIFVIIYSTQYESKFTIFRNPSPPLQERQGQNDKSQTKGREGGRLMKTGKQGSLHKGGLRSQRQRAGRTKEDVGNIKYRANLTEHY